MYGWMETILRVDLTKEKIIKQQTAGINITVIYRVINVIGDDLQGKDFRDLSYEAMMLVCTVVLLAKCLKQENLTE